MTTWTGRTAEPRARGWHPVMWLAIAALLLLPAVAMQFTREVAWDAADFAAAAMLLVGAGAVFELAARRFGDSTRALLACALVAVVGVIWAQGAVGIV